MAAVTENLGFGVTCNLSYEPPYPFARRMSTLDHLTEGRIGWNVVTGYLDSAARGAGKDKQTAHDDRYDVADEYMEVVYKLWEGSWEDDAALRDRARGIFADPAKVHRVHHEGNNYRLDAIHLSEPSPQRTPVLYQAGTSPRGRQFAAQHAECVFMSGPSAKVIAPRVAAIRALAAEAGRNPAEILMFSMMTMILGRTEAEAKAKYADYRQPHQSRGRAHPDVRLDRRRFLDLRPRPAGSPRRERRRPHRDGQHHPRRSGPGLDRARGRPACRHRRHRAGRGRHARKGRRRDRSLVRSDRCRRPERRRLRFRPAISRISSTCWCRNWFGAGVTRTPTRRARLREKLFGAGPRAPRRAASGRAVSPSHTRRRRRSRFTPSLRGALATKQSRGVIPRRCLAAPRNDSDAMDCFACARNDGIFSAHPDRSVDHHLDQLRAGPLERRAQRRLPDPSAR